MKMGGRHSFETTVISADGRKIQASRNGKVYVVDTETCYVAVTAQERGMADMLTVTSSARTRERPEAPCRLAGCGS